MVGEAWKKPRGLIVFVLVRGTMRRCAPETGLNTGRSEWTKLTPGRSSQRGIEESTHGSTCR